jgi:diguanylate cyclase (GGDEF)-like protein
LVQIGTDRAVVYTNQRVTEILGDATATTVDGQLGSVVRDDWPAFDAAITRALAEGADDDVEVQVQRPGERGLRRCQARIRALTDDGTVTGAIVSIEDVTESALLHAELERRATMDMLTRCLNRATVMSSLEATLAEGGDAYTAVIFVDLDDFKAVNDRHGHAVGDELLITAGERLIRVVRQGDYVGRLGGDEFLVICPEVECPDEARRIADRISTALKGEFRLGGSTVALSASVGVACAERRDTTTEDLVSRADSAMYAAKRRRRLPDWTETEVGEA